MNSPVDEIAFLTRSENRLQVLQTLGEEKLTRKDLREDLDISRTTLSRALNEFENRDLIRPTEQGYTTTRAADAILSKLVPLIETIEGIQNLGEAIDWLPPPARSLDFRHFRDAEITTSTVDNPAKPFDRGLELIQTADKYRGLNSTAIPRYMKAFRDRYVEEGFNSEGVIEASFIEKLRDNPERVPPWRDLAETIWMYDGRVPINMHIIDGRVLIWLGELQEDGIEVHGLLESENSAVLSWARTLYKEYRKDAEPLDPEILPVK